MSGNKQSAFSAFSGTRKQTALAALSLSALLITGWSAAPTAHAAGKRAAHQAQQTKDATPALPHLELAQILEKNYAARGGLKKWHAVQALSITGTMDMGRPQVVTRKDIERTQPSNRRVHRNLASAGLHQPGVPVKEDTASTAGTAPVTMPFVLDMKRPHMARLEVVFNNETAIQVFDGEKGWKLRPFTGRHEVEPMTPGELKAASDQEDLDGLLIDHAAKGTQVALEKPEMVDGHPAYRLKLTLKNGDTRHVWIDAKTFLETKVDTPPRRVNGLMRTVSTYYSDYRSVDGLMIPFMIETRIEHTGRAGKMVIDHIRVNPPLEGNRFGKPA